MSNSEGAMFRITTGVPTEPDVKRLREKFGVPTEGDLLPYSDIASVLGADRKSDRFKTVTNSWRRALYREHNVVLEAVPNNGFRCLTPNERIRLSWSRYKGGLRRVWRASSVAEKTDRSKLGKDELNACEHLGRCAAAIRLAVVTSAKQIELPDPQIKRNH